VDPDIRYARNGDIAIAYQVVGDGDRDLVFVPDFVSNLVYAWESPYWREFYKLLARSFRVILFDKRGNGLSDHAGDFATLETRMEDMRVVLDAVGSDRAVVFGSHEGASMAALYAATYPERVDALVVFQLVQFGGGSDDPDNQSMLRQLRAGWGTQEFSDQLLAEICPTLLGRQDDRLWFANSLRLGASPEIAYQLNKAYFDSDLREVLPAIRVPTLVLYRGRLVEDEGVRDTATLVPNARLVRLEGSDFWGMFLSPEIVDEIEQFVASLGEEREPESVLATLLFTDLVDSTVLANELGDQRWAELVGRHHAAVREQLRRFRGTEIDTAGDGFFATFDGPARAIRCGCAIRDVLGELDLGVRVGIHTGECALAGGKPSGIAVSTGARVAAAAETGEVFISQTVKDLVAGSGIALAERGERELKGVPGTWRLYAVAGAP
jgi:class 3 adenylate cyclase/pimeloyl-ACP methyl ester carboxylesterase